MYNLFYKKICQTAVLKRWRIRTRVKRRWRHSTVTVTMTCYIRGSTSVDLIPMTFRGRIWLTRPSIISKILKSTGLRSQENSTCSQVAKIVKKIAYMNSITSSRMAQLPVYSTLAFIFKVKFLTFFLFCEYIANGDR